MCRITKGFVIAFLFTIGKCNSIPWKGPNQLHPVHGLYVQPSADGSTGDLYVAATEDSGSKTQWLTDQPINFLPVGAATQKHSSTVSLPYTASISGSAHDESTQKRAVISPTVQYAYALPVSSGGTEGALTYPYAFPALAAAFQPTSSTSEPSSTLQCANGTAAVPYNPFQFIYPQIMSAYTNVKSILKESGMSDDTAGAIISQAAPMWSPYGAYPMYFMVDPSAWSQAQSQQSSTTTSSKES